MTSPWIDPHMLPILERMRAAAGVDYSTLPHAEGQQVFHAGANYWNKPAVDLAHVRDVTIMSDGQPMKARLYEPSGMERGAMIIYLHGGGWTFGSIESHDRVTRVLAVESRCAVLSIDYRLSPASAAPAAVNDTEAAIQFVASGGAGFSLPEGRIALAGDSAGANIALGTLVRRRNGGRAPLLGAAMYYGCYAPVFDTESHRRFGSGAFGLSTARMQRYWANYLGQIPGSDPIAAPYYADLGGLPPLHINAAGLDPLLDDTLMLAQKLAHAGSVAEIDLVPGVVHGFIQMSSELPAAHQAIKRSAASIRRWLNVLS
jgi:acetyl esterase